MKISKVAELLGAEVCYGKELLENEVHSACGSDMMSDVLAFVKDQAVLLTGLVNMQVVRTAEMMDMRCIVLCAAKSLRLKSLHLQGILRLQFSRQRSACIRRAAYFTRTDL